MLTSISFFYSYIPILWLFSYGKIQIKWKKNEQNYLKYDDYDDDDDDDDDDDYDDDDDNNSNNLKRISYFMHCYQEIDA